MLSLVRRRISRHQLVRGARSGASVPSSQCGDDPRARLAMPMATAFHPEEVERGWYAWWAAHDYFESETRPSGGRYSMVIPPPNVTGALHIGHALTIAVEDAMVRWRRMRGDEVLWIPGLDHAGIATQSVVERMLHKHEGKTRHDLGREAFLKRVMEWSTQYGQRITGQLRALGATLHWDREVFTMSDPMSLAVTEAFVRLHERGLVYRAERLVNWCPHLKTTLSDLEVDYVDVEGPTRLPLPGRDDGARVGVLHTFAYPLEGGEGTLRVSTTRLETMLADSAIAVHPDDERYRHAHGRHVVHPINGRRLPVVVDAELVDPALGTGCVKVTPAHDPNDFACGQRHGLPMINMLTDAGTVNDQGGPFAGMDRFAARAALVHHLRSCGLYEGEEAHPMRIGVCSRSGDIVEPVVKPQWFVRCDGMAERALAQTEGGEVEILPASQRVVWRRWLEGIRDWCISRQLWWGHRIPAYRVVGPGDQPSGASGDGPWVVGRSEEEARDKASRELGVPPDQVRLEQDEDVLDTWFSSGIFPLSTLGWPHGTGESGVPPEGRRMYPLDAMETGADILFFWVARMSMLCTELGDGRTPPFKRVLLHPVVRDRQGRKMSKSLGNVIDPLHVIHGASREAMAAELRRGNLDAAEVQRAEGHLAKDLPQGIPALGTDALRVALADYMRQGRQINMDLANVHRWRRFGNKMWQATRFALGHVDRSPGQPSLRGAAAAAGDEAKPLDPVPEWRPDRPARDRWIMQRLARAADEVQAGLHGFDLARSTTAFSDFFQGDLCDTYLEMVKPVLQGNDGGGDGVPGRRSAEAEGVREVLFACLDASMRLAHPFMPFVTEELWQRLQVGAARAAISPEGAVHLRAPGQPRSLVAAPWPSTEDARLLPWAEDGEAGEDMGVVLDVLAAARSLSASARPLLPAAAARPDGVGMPVIVLPNGGDAAAARASRVLADYAEDVAAVLRVPQLPVLARSGPHELGVSLVARTAAGCEVRVPLAGDGDTVARIDAEAERLGKRLAKAQRSAEALAAQRKQPQYVARAGEDVRERDAERARQLDAEMQAMEQSRETLRALREEMCGPE